MQAYKEINTFIALTGFEVWTDNDKITVSPVAGATLESFTQWRNNDLMKRQKHDNAHFLRSALMWGKYNIVNQLSSELLQYFVCFKLCYGVVLLNGLGTET